MLRQHPNMYIPNILPGMQHTICHHEYDVCALGEARKLISFVQVPSNFVIHFATSIPNVPTAKKLMKKNQTYCII